MIFELKIKNGIFDIASSGAIIVNSNEPTTLTIFDDGNPMDIVLRFENDPSEKMTKTVNKIEGRNAFEILFTNYNSPLGTFTKQLWYIGSSNNRKMYLTYEITDLSESDLKKIVYTIYLGEEVQNG